MGISLKKTKFILIALALIFLSVSCINKIQEPANTSYSNGLTVSFHKIFVEIAETPQAITKGLSGRDKITDTQGMLFILKDIQNSRPGFWMNGMKFDLDLVWIKNNEIVELTQKISHTDMKTYYPSEDVDMVLEVNSGWCDEFQIKAGDKVNLLN